MRIEVKITEWVTSEIALPLIVIQALRPRKTKRIEMNAWRLRNFIDLAIQRVRLGCKIDSINSVLARRLIAQLVAGWSPKLDQVGQI